MTNKLKVEYQKRLVGFLILSKDNKILFQYDEAWIKSGFSLNPFKLPLRDTILNLIHHTLMACLVCLQIHYRIVMEN